MSLFCLVAHEMSRALDWRPKHVLPGGVARGGGLLTRPAGVAVVGLAQAPPPGFAYYVCAIMEDCL